jgi:hypothetical protein
LFYPLQKSCTLFQQIKMGAVVFSLVKDKTSSNR